MVKKIVLRKWNPILNEYIESELPLDLIDEGDTASFPIGSGEFAYVDNPKPVNWVIIYK